MSDLIRVFEQLQGVPQRFVFDNFKAAVLRPRPHLRLHPVVADFCAHYGIEPAPALIYSPQRKGKVERAFLDLEHSEVLRQGYPDLAALQTVLEQGDAAHAEHVVSTTGERPSLRLLREQPFLLPLPPVPFDPRVPETRRVLSDCTISYRGAYYSVPYTLVGKQLTLKVNPEGTEWELFAGATWITRHHCVAKGQRVSVEAHIAPLRQARWDRVAQRKEASPPRRPEPPAPTLVVWPQVNVEQRSLQDYATLIEEVQTCPN